MILELLIVSSYEVTPPDDSLSNKLIFRVRFGFVLEMELGGGFGLGLILGLVFHFQMRKPRVNQFVKNTAESFGFRFGLLPTNIVKAWEEEEESHLADYLDLRSFICPAFISPELGI